MGEPAYSDADIASLASHLIGMTMAEVREFAAHSELKLRDSTLPGWYTDEYDRWRITVTTDDSGIVITAIRG